MSTEVTQTRTGFLKTNEDMFAALGDLADSIKGGGGKPFMKFNGNEGTYSYGADDEELPLQTQLGMNPMSFRQGWVVWKGGEVVEEKMVGLGDAMPAKGSLQDNGPYDGEGDGPQEQFTIEFATIEEPFVQMTFQANNTSKRRAMGTLLKEFKANFRLNPGKFPVIEIDAKEFEAKIKNSKRKVKKFAPSFKIVGWITEEEMNALSEGSPSDYEQEGGGENAIEGAAPVEAVEAETPVKEQVQRPQPQRPVAGTAAPASNRAAPKKLNRF